MAETSPERSSGTCGSRTYDEALRDLRRTFEEHVEAHRPALWRYCRHLTGEVFLAEDLVQDTLLKAFAGLSERFEPLRSPRAYLFRIATTTWLDGVKRRREVLAPSELPEPEGPDGPPITGREVEQALKALVHEVPPRELAVLLLRDVFAFTGPETAEVLRASEAAVKMALVRGRRRARALTPSAPSTSLGGGPPPDLLVQLLEAFRAHDVAAIAHLLHPHARARAVGCAREEGRDEVLRGTMGLATAHPDLVDGSVVPFEGEWIGLVWYRGAGGLAVSDVVRIEIAEDQIAGVVFHWFCPEVLEAVGQALGVAVALHGRRPPAGATWWNVR